MIITSDLDIICLQFTDPNFFLKNTIPNDDTRVICDGIYLKYLSKIKVEDSSNSVIQDKDIGDILPAYITHSKES